jgi:hypothetical protein
LDEFWRAGGQCTDFEGIQDSAPNTFKERLLILPPAKEVPILKNGMSFNFTSDDETKIIYILA